MLGDFAAAASCPAGTYTQLYTSRYVPPALAGPPAWPRLQEPVETAVHAGPSAAWLQTNNSVVCCPNVTNLADCTVIAGSVAGAMVRTAPSAANGGAEYVGLHASVGSVSVSSCTGCVCTWTQVRVGAMARINDVAVTDTPSGTSVYLATDAGLFEATGAAGAQQMTPVAGTKQEAFFAVASSRLPLSQAESTAGSGDISLAAISANATWTWRPSSESGGARGLRKEWNAGFFGSANNSGSGPPQHPTSLAFGDGPLFTLGDAHSPKAAPAAATTAPTLWVGAAQALHGMDAATGLLTRYQGNEGLPANRILSLGAGKGGLLWLGTAAGAALRIDGREPDPAPGTGAASTASTASTAGTAGTAAAPEWRWLSGSRWLPTTEALARVVAVDAAGSPPWEPSSGSGAGAAAATAPAAALLTTADGGVARVTVACADLADKASVLHDAGWGTGGQGGATEWNGLNGRSVLTRFGDPESATCAESDNNGLWTCWKLLASCLRYNATAEADPEAAWEAGRDISSALAALQRLNYVTGVPGFVARTLAAPGQNITTHMQTHWGWNDSPTMRGYRFVGNTSSDELTGHLAAYPLALLLAPDALSGLETQLCTELLTNITLRVIRNGFKILDVDGKTPTRWGNYAPASLNDDPAWQEERGVNSVQILAHLLLTHRVTGLLEIERAFWTLVHEHGYAQNMVNQVITSPDDINFSDDSLTFVPYLAMHYACSEAVGGVMGNATRAMCAAVAPQLRLSLRRAWASLRRNEAGLYSFAYAVLETGLGGPGSAAAAAEAAAIGRRALQRYPLELIGWPTDASVRIDVGGDVDLLPALNYSRVAWPRDECSAFQWEERGEFGRGKDGSGLFIADPVHFLLPYWLGRREGLL